MKILHNIARPQGVLIDVMSHHTREDDDLDCVLRDALRSSGAMAPDPERVFELLRARLAQERQPTRSPWSLAAPGWTSCYMSASYWYLAPLTRGLR